MFEPPESNFYNTSTHIHWKMGFVFFNPLCTLPTTTSCLNARERADKLKIFSVVSAYVVA